MKYDYRSPGTPEPTKVVHREVVVPLNPLGCEDATCMKIHAIDDTHLPPSVSVNRAAYLRDLLAIAGVHDAWTAGWRMWGATLAARGWRP